MALSKTITFKGIAVPNAYLKVWQIQGNKTDIEFGLGYYADADSEMFDSKTFSFSYSIDGDNPIKQAYAHLKTLDEFSDATDC